MLQFARTYGHLDSTDVNDVQSKMWTIRHVLQSYLSVQHVQQAFVLLENVQKGEYGVKASSRYYDPFTNYYGVRGKTEDNGIICMTSRNILLYYWLIYLFTYLFTCLLICLFV